MSENICLSPEKTVLGLSGNLTLKEAEAFAQRLLGDLKAPGKKLPLIPSKKHKKGINRVTLPLDKSQAVFLTGFPACTAGHRDRYALEILKEATGSMSSRLFDVVRNQNGLAYYTGIRLMDFATAGSLIYYAGTEKDSLGKLEELFEEEIARVRDKGLTLKEIEEAKKWIIFREAVKKQNPGVLIGIMCQEEFFGNPAGCVLEKDTIMEALSAEEINKTVSSYLASSTRLTLTVVPEEKKKNRGKKA